MGSSHGLCTRFELIDWHIDLLRELLRKSIAENEQTLKALTHLKENPGIRTTDLLATLAQEAPSTNFRQVIEQAAQFTEIDGELTKIIETLCTARLDSLRELQQLFDANDYDAVASNLRAGAMAITVNNIAQYLDSWFSKSQKDEVTLLELMAKRFDEETGRKEALRRTDPPL